MPLYMDVHKNVDGATRTVFVLNVQRVINSPFARV